MPRTRETEPPLVTRMGESALLATFGTRITKSANLRVHALTRHMRRLSPPGLIDLVPAYASLLVRFDPSLADEAALSEHLVEAETDEPAEASGRTHTVPVTYGGDFGPDLEELAHTRGLDADSVIRLHTGRAYMVYFLGFMPGFAYMGSVSRSIASPRLASPRTRVPAGSVGIAGRQTGIYPMSSPGGWRIIGRTSYPLWDVTQQPPATFAPGDLVRFVSSDWQETDLQAGQLSRLPIRPVFQVVTPGALTTVQDLGRPGYGSTGLPQGGAMDPTAVWRANALVGNAPDAAVLETVWTGLTLLALRTVTVAVAGAEGNCYVDSFRVPEGCSWLVRGGSTVRFEPLPGGRVAGRIYLAVSGGFEVPDILGSRATYLPASVGGYSGRALAAGDLLGSGQSKHEPVAVAGRNWTRERRQTGHVTTLKIMRFAGVQKTTNRAFRHLLSNEWTVDERSDRMGTRLRSAGESHLQGRRHEQTSFGVVRGAVQLPPDGNPIILNADHQTTGGYPLLGAIAEVTWPHIASLVPGDRVRFEEIRVEDAREALITLREQLRAGYERLVRTLR